MTVKKVVAFADEFGNNSFGFSDVGVKKNGIQRGLAASEHIGCNVRATNVLAQGSFAILSVFFFGDVELISLG